MSACLRIGWTAVFADLFAVVGRISVTGFEVPKCGLDGKVLFASRELGDVWRSLVGPSEETCNLFSLGERARGGGNLNVINGCELVKVRAVVVRWEAFVGVGGGVATSVGPDWVELIHGTVTCIF